MSEPSLHDLITFRYACIAFNIKDTSTVVTLVHALDILSKQLAQSEDIRKNVGADPDVWNDLRKLWRDLACIQLTFWDGDDADAEGSLREQNKQESLKALCKSLAKFTRNLVAGVPKNQKRAFENEPDIRRLLHYHTSWSALENSESVSAAQLLTQALSNIVTANEELLSTLWRTYMDLPEDQVVLIRILSTKDPHILLSSFIFILNCLHGSRKRTKMLSRTTVGVRVCISLLDDMLYLYDAEDGTASSQAFDVGYGIFTRLIEEGLVPDLYHKFSVPDEIITPHQTTLLKLIDSHLQSIIQNTPPQPSSEVFKLHASLSPFIARCFYAKSTYAQTAIKRALGLPDRETRTLDKLEQQNSRNDEQPTSPLSELDVMLPKVCEALVLVTQCMITISLEAEEQKSRDSHGVPPTNKTNMKVYFNETRSSGRGMVESLIELLRLLDLFLPRINFGKPVPSSSSKGVSTSNSDSTGFAYLKRDLVRLAGVLCHAEKSVQNRIRKIGGIPVIMNLCSVDERNPYLREHAIFALHNLLKGNPENQAVVDAMKPSTEWDENGVLRQNA